MNTITPLVSYNFAIAKVLAILLVATGHFFNGFHLWIPVTIGLFTFAWSSALFSTLKHSNQVNVIAFWRNKLKRLGLRFLLIQVFLFALVVLQGRDGLFTWQTLLHFTGQSGWINWFGIHNASPLGSGLWFFTLLLLFYLAFPILVRWQQNTLVSSVITLVTVVAAWWLSRTFDVGHALWITATAFVLGIHCAWHPLPGSAKFWLALAIAAALAMGFLNVGPGIRAANPALIILCALAAVQWLEKTSLTLPAGPLASLTPCVLEIYLIHTYLFMGTNWPRPLAYLTSMAAIIAVALVLNFLITQLENHLVRQS
ncbi:hypothetical protein AGMMS50256_37980 [Betaproteobacteria bacterium]|nr:hypothetical protein AGMMS50256_37980 [Betaproteobacteria bacterium]